MTLANDFLHGVNTLNRMKAEIGQVMRVLAGSIKEETVSRSQPGSHGPWYTTSLDFETSMGSIHWEITLFGERLGIYCWLSKKENPVYEFQFTTPSKLEERAIRLEHIVQVYFSLSQFIHEVRYWGKVHENLWPIFAAAQDFKAA